MRFPTQSVQSSQWSVSRSGMLLSVVSVKRDLGPNSDRIKVFAGLLPLKEASAFLEYLEQNPQLTAKAAFRKHKANDPAGYPRRCYLKSSLLKPFLSGKAPPKFEYGLRKQPHYS